MEKVDILFKSKLKITSRPHALVSEEGDMVLKGYSFKGQIERSTQELDGCGIFGPPTDVIFFILLHENRIGYINQNSSEEYKALALLKPVEIKNIKLAEIISKHVDLIFTIFNSTESEIEEGEKKVGRISIKVIDFKKYKDYYANHIFRLFQDTVHLVNPAYKWEMTPSNFNTKMKN